MAGEIQIDSVTALTASGSNIVLNNVDTATNRTNLGLGSIATQASGSIDIDGGAIDGVTIGTNSAATDVRVDNLKLDGNTISSTNTDGNIVLDPNGTGNVLLGNFTLDADQTVGAGQDNMVLTYDYAQGTIGLEAAANAGTIASQDSDAVAITGGSITGTEFDLKSTGTSVYKSNGSTAVISESGGTATLNNVTLGSGVVFPANKIINVHSVAKTDNFSTLVENSWIDITGLSVSFTKSSSSKILVMVMLSIGSPNNYQRVFRLNRNGSSIFTNTSTASGLKGTIGQPNEYGGSDRQLSTHPMVYLDTTTDTSMTYKVQGFTPSISADHVGFYVNSPSSPDSNSHLAVSSITCFEISQ